jgi:A/G-specific adenine glycosylase
MERKLPVKGKAAPPKVEKRTVLIVRKNGKVLMHQRPGKGLLAGLWEFPGVKARGKGRTERALKKGYGLSVSVGKNAGKTRHVFSHRIWDISVREGELRKGVLPALTRLRWVHINRMGELAIPIAFRNVVEMLGSMAE